jgi:hypothetical protein
MKTRPLAVALLVALAPASFPLPAAAQSGAEDPVTAMARARFKEGVEFYDKGQFEQARAAFLQAYALKKHPAVLLNLAWSCLKSGHALDAERYFKQFLTEGKDATDKQRADATDGSNQARNKIGRIDVVAPQGTEITIDGDRVGAAPLGDPVAVEPGAHTVTFKGPDTATETQSVSVLGGEKAIVRFGRKSASDAAPAGGAPAPAPSAPPATPPAAAPTETPSEPAAAPPEDTTHASHAAPKEKESRGGPGLFTPPDNLVPVVIGGVLVAASAGVAIAMLVGKSAANDSAATTANQLSNAMLGCDPSNGQPIMAAPGGNVQPLPPNDPRYSKAVDACNSYNTDINNVNTDATIGNIAIGVGIAALAGTVIYWIVGDKSADAPARSGFFQPTVVPMVTATSGGAAFSLSGRF